MYRKSRLFPFTEQVPPWLDGPTLRRWLPWVGNWQPGNGARVLPLQLADGREIPVLPLICLDDVDTDLAIQGARLGAQAILTMSNDAWFTAHPQGARLHQAVAAFRSIETGLSQFRVTTNGYSAAIDATGAVRVASPLGERNLLIADLPVAVPTPTLLVRWGDWVGRAGACLVLLLGLGALWRRMPTPQPFHLASDALGSQNALLAPSGIRVCVMPPLARVSVGLLRVIARASLLCMGVAMLLYSDLQSNTLAQIRLFTSLFLAPELAAWCVLWAFSARAGVENGALVLSRGANRMELALDRIAALTPWRMPLPGPGVAIELTTGGRWHYGLAVDNPNGLANALARAGAPAAQPPLPSIWSRYLQAVLDVPRGRLGHPLLKFGVLPTVLALGAFRLHQHIAYGSSFGEYYTFGLKTYAISFGLWWAAWLIGVVLCAAALRAAIELGTVLAAALWPAQATQARYALQNLGLAMLYIGMPAWLLLRAFGG
jgi:apolipoprotein N-acyltransferase